jgi:hypothetical protein
VYNELNDLINACEGSKSASHRVFFDLLCANKIVPDAP